MKSVNKHFLSLSSIGCTCHRTSCQLLLPANNNSFCFGLDSLITLASFFFLLLMSWLLLIGPESKILLLQGYTSVSSFYKSSDMVTRRSHAP